jgi:hypothetical protein
MEHMFHCHHPNLLDLEGLPGLLVLVLLMQRL